MCHNPVVYFEMCTCLTCWGIQAGGLCQNRHSQLTLSFTLVLVLQDAQADSGQVVRSFGKVVEYAKLAGCRCGITND
jgi:hypothetical protein